MADVLVDGDGRLGGEVDLLACVYTGGWGKGEFREGVRGEVARRRKMDGRGQNRWRARATVGDGGGAYRGGCGRSPSSS